MLLKKIIDRYAFRRSSRRNTFSNRPKRLRRSQSNHELPLSYLTNVVRARERLIVT